MNCHQASKRRPLWTSDRKGLRTISSTPATARWCATEVSTLTAIGWLGVGNDLRYSKTRCFDPFPFPACDEAAKARIRVLGEDLDAHRKRVQAQHPGLSLTAMYNVLEALRAGRALTPKETGTHDAGLVSVLRQLHDELDAAVATAYGWTRDGRPETDLTDAEILTRLVALNAARAAEEATGQIRYLRPEYQRMKDEGGRMNEQTSLKLPASAPLHPSSLRLHPSKTPWPKPLAERVAAVERALAASASPVIPAQLAKHFLRAKPEDLAEILETLGRAHREGKNIAARRQHLSDSLEARIGSPSPTWATRGRRSPGLFLFRTEVKR